MSRVKKAEQEAFQKLAAGKRGANRLADLDFDKDEKKKVFDVVGEDDYQKIVANRRKGDDFVVDDEGLGYADDGEERYDDGEGDDYDDDEEAEDHLGDVSEQIAGSGKRSKPSKPAASKIKSGIAAFVRDAAAPSEDIGGKGKTNKATSNTNKATNLDALLGDLEDDASDLGSKNLVGGSGLGGTLRLSGVGRKPVQAKLASLSYAALIDLDKEIENAAPADIGEDDEAEDVVGNAAEGRFGASSAGDASDEGRAAMEVEGAEEHDVGAPSAAAAPRAPRLHQAAAAGKRVAPSQLQAMQREKAERIRKQQEADAAAAAAAAAAAQSTAGGWLGVGSGAEEASASPPSALAISSPAAGNLGGAPFIERVPMVPRPGIPEDLVGKPVDSFLFYWLDACEDKSARGVVNGGSIHLFGKVMVNAADVMAAARVNAVIRDHAVAASGGEESTPPLPAVLATAKKEVTPKFASCCLTVSGLQRCVYVLPRQKTATTGEDVDFAAMHKEVLETLWKYLGKNAKILAKPVERNYAFELPDVPREKIKYLKVLYDGKLPALPSDLSGETFSRVFGTHASPLENFLLKRDLMGPCWVRVLNARVTGLGPGLHQGTPVSWCYYEAVTDDPKNILRYQQGSNAALQKLQFEAAKASATANGLPFHVQPPPGIDRGLALLPAPSQGSFAAAAVAATAAAMTGAHAVSHSLSDVFAAIPLSLLEAHVPLPPPELVVMSLSMKTAVHPKTHNHEVVVLSILVHKSVQCDGPSREEASAMSSQIILRPLGAAQPLPADLKSEIAKLAPGVRNSIAVEANEKVLLNRAMAYIGKHDPDVLVGHNICGFDLDVLLSRCEKNNVSTWSKIGRLRRNQFPRGTSGSGGRTSYMGANPSAGRLLCDTYLAARELIRETTYTLQALAFTQLHEKRLDIDPLEVPSFLTGGIAAARVLQLLQHTEMDARLALRLMFVLQVLPLTKQLTNLAGNLWSRSLRGARAERIEYLLLHEFHRLKYVLPDKESRFGASAAWKSSDDDDPAQELALLLGDDDEEHLEGAGGAGAGNKKGKYASKTAKDGGGTAGVTGSIARFSKKRAKAAYSGGLVLEPKKGLYDKFVLMLDFNSLYPSIIQEYNICFTTVERQTAPLPSSETSGEEIADMAADTGGENSEVLAAAASSPSPGLPSGIALPDREKYREEAPLPRVIRSLVEKRRQVKALLNKETDPAKRQALDIRQKALKILANSMYGCLGFSGSRFYAKPLAALVTLQGRDILQRTVSLAETTLGCEVIYGDTDSIMIYTGKSDIKEVKAMGNQVKKEVNQLYRKLEIEVDGIFASMLLLKKKKYAALVATEGPGGTVSVTREMKGLDMVRRDWCVLSRELGVSVLDIILSGKERDEIVESIHALLTTASADMRENKIPIEKFTITKGLNKNPHDYPDVKGQPHLQVALSMMKSGKNVNVGDHIPYVICKEPVSTVNLDGSSSSSAEALDGTGIATKPSSAAASITGPAARAYHPDEVKKGIAAGVLHIDIEWYLTQQILPPVSRLCEPIAGTSQQRLALCLGLDASRFSGRTSGGRGDDVDSSFVPRYLSLASSGAAERFVGVDRLIVGCPECRQVSVFPGVFSRVKTSSSTPVTLYSGLTCQGKGCSGTSVLLPCTLPSGYSSSKDAAFAVAAIPQVRAGSSPIATATALFYAAVGNKIRSAVLLYGQGLSFCDESLCPFFNNGTKSLTSKKEGFGCPRVGCRGVMSPDFGHSKLHTQLEYFNYLFDENAERSRLESQAEQASKSSQVNLDVPTHIPKLPGDHAALLASVRDLVKSYLTASAYHFVSPALFAYVAGANKSYGMSSGGPNEGKKGLSKKSAAIGGPGPAAPLSSAADVAPPAPMAKRQRLE